MGGRAARAKPSAATLFAAPHDMTYMCMYMLFVMCIRATVRKWYAGWAPVPAGQRVAAELVTKSSLHLTGCIVPSAHENPVSHRTAELELTQ